MWGGLAACGRLAIGLLAMTRKLGEADCQSAAGCQPAPHWLSLAPEQADRIGQPAAAIGFGCFGELRLRLSLSGGQKQIRLQAMLLRVQIEIPASRGIQRLMRAALDDAA